MTTEQRDECMSAFLVAVMEEYWRAVAAYPEPRQSVHEGYAYALEELDELWAEIKKPNAVRSREAMRLEAVQAAAMLVRLAVECGLMDDAPDGAGGG